MKKFIEKLKNLLKRFFESLLDITEVLRELDEEDLDYDYSDDPYFYRDDLNDDFFDDDDF